jgi:hypothetical protein
MGREPITYDRVLKELNNKFCWTYKAIDEGSQGRISFKEFKKILILEKITTSERKVKEMWNLMTDLDFFIKINKSEIRIVDLAAVATVLGHPVLNSDDLKTEEVEA